MKSQLDLVTQSTTALDATVIKHCMWRATSTDRMHSVGGPHAASRIWYLVLILRWRHLGGAVKFAEKFEPLIT